MLKKGSVVEFANRDNVIKTVIFCGKGIRKNNTILVIDHNRVKKLVNISRIITIDGVSPNITTTTAKEITECDTQVSVAITEYTRLGHSLATIISAISLILWEKADHLESVWQDHYQAKQYKRVSNYFVKLAYKIDKKYIPAYDSHDWTDLETLIDHYGLQKVVRSIAGGLPRRENNLFENVLLKTKVMGDLL